MKLWDGRCAQYSHFSTFQKMFSQHFASVVYDLDDNNTGDGSKLMISFDLNWANGNAGAKFSLLSCVWNVKLDMLSNLHPWNTSSLPLNDFTLSFCNDTRILLIHTTRSNTILLICKSTTLTKINSVYSSNKKYNQYRYIVSVWKVYIAIERKKRRLALWISAIWSSEAKHWCDTPWIIRDELGDQVQIKK